MRNEYLVPLWLVVFFKDFGVYFLVSVTFLRLILRIFFKVVVQFQDQDRDQEGKVFYFLDSGILSKIKAQAQPFTFQ